MDSCGGRHGVMVALFLTLRLGLWNCQEVEVSPPPVTLEISADSLHHRLLLEGTVTRKMEETDTDMRFHIQVARSEKMNIIENEYLQPDLSTSHTTFHWSWDSSLPLECDSHSVRIRAAVVGRGPKVEINWSEWGPWTTHHGQNKERNRTTIFPHERVVLVGSDVTFCCLPVPGRTVREMTYGGVKVKPSQDLGTDSFVISVKNVKMTKSEGSNVICVLDKNGNMANPGTVLLVTKLPDEPKHFSCSTQDLQSLSCRWDPGARHNYFRSLSVNYTLQEWFSMKSIPCHRNNCDWPIKEKQQIYNFTLIAKHVLGERSINSIVNLKQRVLLLAPSSLTASYVNASDISLIWSLRANYTSLRIHCQVPVQENQVNLMTAGKLPTDIYQVDLSGLHPHTRYDLGVRCMAESSLAGWSSWTHLPVWTREDEPTGVLDVWRHIDEDEDGEGRHVTLYWRPSSLFRANGLITHYNIRFWPLEGAPVHREITVSGVNSTQISIGRRAYTISISAHNKVGGSQPAELRIPAYPRSGTEQIIPGRTYGRDGGILMRWEQRPSIQGYVVEWCTAPRTPHCDLQWMKYNSTIQGDVIIQSGGFRPGVRYNFRILGCMRDGEQVLEEMEGYTQELVSSVTPNVKISDIEPRSIILDWSPYPTDGSQEGFIIGYNVYVNDTKDDCDLEKSDDIIQWGGSRLCRFYIEDPNKMQITINKLKPNGKYKVAVTAITGGGETMAEFIEAHTPADAAAALHSMLVPVITLSALGLLLLIIGCWKRAWLKRIFLPDIPDPNKSKILFFNGTKGPLIRNSVPTTYGEPQKVDVVTLQENRPHKTHKEVNVSPELQLHEIYTTSDGEEEVNECYIPCDNENSLYPPMNQSQLPLYLEFFNQSYTSTVDDGSDGAQGYKPQMNTATVHSPTYLIQSVDPELGSDEDRAISLNSPSEPMSPTSVGSNTFILVG